MTRARRLCLLIGGLAALLLVLVLGLLVPSSEHRSPVSVETNAVAGRDEPPSASTATTINGSGIPVYLYEGTVVVRCAAPLRSASADRVTQTPPYHDSFHVLSDLECGAARREQRAQLLSGLIAVGLATAGAFAIMGRRSSGTDAEERPSPVAG